MQYIIEKQTNSARAEREACQIIKVQKWTSITVSSEVKLNMGNTKSKTSQNTGDHPQVQILDQLKVHEEYHSLHEMKLNIILVILLIQIVITIVRIFKEQSKKHALRVAKSIDNVANL